MKEPNNIIALLAIVVSIAALIFSVIYSRRTLKITIKHNKLSVEPILSIYSHSCNNDNKYDAFLRNAGMGPAILTSIKYLYKNNKYKSIFDLLEGNNTTLYDAFNGEKSSIGSITKGYTILPQNEFNLFKIVFDKEKDFLHFLSFMNQVVIKVKFETIYGDKLYNEILMVSYPEIA